MVHWASCDKCSPQDLCTAIKYFVTVQTLYKLYIYKCLPVSCRGEINLLNLPVHLYM